jgi:hypothetical protein
MGFETQSPASSVNGPGEERCLASQINASAAMQHTDDHDDGHQHRRERNDAVYELSELNAAGMA